MKCRHRVIVLAAIVLAAPLAVLGASGQAEESSGERAHYLAGQGIIVHPRDVEVHEFISTVDYGYPEPEGLLGVTAYPGQYQLSSRAQEMILSIGVQAARRSLEDLPPLNIVFVIDVSGSMGAANKIDWVRQSLEFFEGSMRTGDTVSLVAFSNEADVRLPTTRIAGDRERRGFLTAVRGLHANGGTNLYGGLETGFAQLLPQLSSERVNRIILLSDGLPTVGVQDPGEFRSLAQSYRELGVSISAIGLGTEADLALIRDIAHWSSGTSRFINNRETMEEIFGSGLGRLIVPVAREVVLDVRLAPGVSVAETWGYEHRIVGSTVTYSIPALHDSDYETIVLVLNVPGTTATGTQRLATVEASYLDDDGSISELPHVPVDAERVSIDAPVSGATDAMALRAETMLRYGQVLVEVGQRYYDDRARTPEGGVAADVAESLLGLVSRFRFEMENAELRLDEPVFEQELTVLAKYQDILAEELRIAEEQRRSRYDAYRPVAPVRDREIHDHVTALVSEVRYSMRSLPPGSVALLGFAGLGELDPELHDLVRRETRVGLSGLPRFPLLAVERVDQIERDPGYDPASLNDTALAAALGRELGVDYVVTGILVASPRTYHFFERVIRCADGNVLSAAQVMVAR